jgi:hypothetical protein
LRDVSREIAEQYAQHLVSRGLSANRFNKHLNFLALLFRVLHDKARMNGSGNGLNYYIVGHANPAMTRHYTHIGKAAAATTAVAALPDITGTVKPALPASDAVTVPVATLRELADGLTPETAATVRRQLLDLVRNHYTEWPGINCGKSHKWTTTVHLHHFAQPARAFLRRARCMPRVPDRT